MLGRPGPVCPFVPRAPASGSLWAVVVAADLPFLPADAEHLVAYRAAFPQRGAVRATP
ncbi:hypothetical protein ACIGNX_02835 [Actinosynnema sp. NPDC053489]|uniref:hypothetical protein n=1 Tax=Actinosynnema sp. NPDC053489 TaxID=3363916 RepID=UPI0037CC77B8